MTDKDETEALGVQPLAAPRFAPISFEVMATPVSVTIVCQTPLPVMTKDGTALVAHPECILNLSLQGAAELSELLAEIVRRHEAEYGEVRTPYLDARKSGG